MPQQKMRRAPTTRRQPSSSPRKDDEITGFFEMVLKPSKGLSLVRYRYDPDRGKRTTISAPLTRDTLERRIDDLIELAQGP
jgi:hypothetical protein